MSLKKIVIVVVSLFASSSLAEVSVVKTYGDSDNQDQDDMCIWVPLDDPGRATIIGSDKDSGDISVFDLDGNLLQRFNTGKPGNIDIRYGFKMGRECFDVVAFNERGQHKILVYIVDSYSRKLVRIPEKESAGTQIISVVEHPERICAVHCAINTYAPLFVSYTSRSTQKSVNHSSQVFGTVNRNLAIETHI